MSFNQIIEKKKKKIAIFVEHWRMSFPVPCAAGTYFSAEDNDCRPCPAGFHQPNTKQTQCDPCPPGSTTTMEGSANCSGQCPETTGNVICKRSCVQNSQLSTGPTRKTDETNPTKAVRNVPPQFQFPFFFTKCTNLSLCSVPGGSLRRRLLSNMWILRSRGL